MITLPSCRYPSGLCPSCRQAVLMRYCQSRRNVARANGVWCDRKRFLKLTTSAIFWHSMMWRYLWATDFVRFIFDTFPRFADTMGELVLRAWDIVQAFIEGPDTFRCKIKNMERQLKYTCVSIHSSPLLADVAKDVVISLPPSVQRNRMVGNGNAAMSLLRNILPARTKRRTCGVYL